MRIVLFGGAFDPPHLGHQQVAAGLLEANLADQVWFVPVKTHSFAKTMTAPEHRLKMLQLIQLANTKIETYELDQTEINYTFNTLDALAIKYPDHTFSWVIGSDNLAKFHLWGDRTGRNFQQLLNNYQFFVYPRHGFPFEPLYSGMIPLRDFPEVTVSSTQVRQMVAQGQSLTGFVAPLVANYIQTQGLYLESISNN
jgi:nicotinate-nucleotide adenylyltransferase